MPNWNQVLREVQQKNAESTSAIDSIRRKYLSRLSKHTQRNVIAYYSGWLDNQRNTEASTINDGDKNAFMNVIHGLDRKKGLDIILHTPGGGIAAAESLVDYLRRMFDTNIRAIIPQIAMSAGTMIACATSSIVMGKQSNLGPIDPQIGGLSASGILEEFDKAVKQVDKEPASVHIWQSIIGKYHPSLLGECENAIAWSEKMVKVWLETGMFKAEQQAKNKADKVVRALSDRKTTLNHSRHIHIDECIASGLTVEKLEDDPTLQDLVLTVHHAYMHTFSMAPAAKIIENHVGNATIRMIRG